MIAIISDIHGNFPALKAVLKEIYSYGITKIFCLGDVAGYYCMLNECINILKKCDIVLIKGNHDHYLLNNQACLRSHTATACLEFQRKTITSENKKWLATGKNKIISGEMSLVHGGWHDHLEEYLIKFNENYFSKQNETIFFSGHTHIQRLEIYPMSSYCNPGSVGQPRDGDKKAAFAIMDSANNIFLQRVPYDIDQIASNMRINGFKEYVYKNLFSGTCINNTENLLTEQYKNI